jgi:hypothetical protein
VGCEGVIFENADAAFEANAETVHCGSIPQFSRPPIRFRRRKFVPPDPSAVLEAAAIIVESIGMRKQGRSLEITKRQIDVWADADSALEAAAEAV